MAGRGAFQSRLGFMMAAIGSAVGLGNLWRFPYVTSTNGGAAFIVLYLAFLFLIGLPALFAELSIGRNRARNAVGAFTGTKEDGSPDKRFTWVGFIFLGTAVLLLSYYSVIAGWALRYMFDSATAPYFDGAASYFATISVDPMSILFHLLFMAITIGILVRGVSGGIEKANLMMMPVLFAFVVGLVIYGNLQSGAQAGREFFLIPDFDAINRTTFNEAAGQTFFSIGLGLGTMLTYSSYIGKETDLQSTGMIIGFADTGVAVLAGLMVFPLMFALGLGGLADDAGASSVGGLFIALPTAFAEIGGTFGGLLAFGFFLMLGFAALSSAISLLEVPISYVVDRFPHWGRARAVLLVGLSTYILGLPAAISMDWFGIADSLVSNILLLLGGLMLVIYTGWIKPEILDELSVGRKGWDMGKIFRPIIKYPLPVFLVVLLGFGFEAFFKGL